MTHLIMLVALLGLAQDTPQKQVKNQQEFDLYNAARNEQDPAKKLMAVDEWKAKFPDTDFREDRNLFYLSAYLGLEANALKAGAAPDAMAAGEKVARTVIENVEAIFAAAIKPAYIKDSDWAAVRLDAESRSHWMLAVSALNRKDYKAEEAELVKYLTFAPKDSNASLMLSRAIIGQGNQDRYPEAVFQVARAAGEVTGAQKKTLEDSLVKMYEGYHGELTGLDQVKELAVKSVLPPQGWTIKSVTEISKEQIAAEEQFRKDYPEVATWRLLRDKLTAADGEAYFQSQLKNIELPPLKGRILGQNSPKELTVLMDYVAPARPPAVADATIKLDAPLKTKLEPGTVFTLTGAVAESFNKDPYRITMTVERKGLQVVEQR